MKIAILTQPLMHNYGGLLQAYALQKYLNEMGHEVLTVDLRYARPKLWGLRGKVRNIIYRIFLNRKAKNVHTNRFIRENIKKTEPIYPDSDFGELKNLQFDAYVVGSDQVWRPEYSPKIEAYFLSFLEKTTDAKKISYSASFGVDNCNAFSSDLLSLAKGSLKRFDAVSVREDTGVDICEKHFDISAQQVIDPTLLIQEKDYSELIESDNSCKSDGSMMVYVLDRSQDKVDLINQVEHKLNLKQYTVMLNESPVYPPVTKWLRGFRDAEYVVTDSFHGVVFSIIFNKPFLAIGNKERGLTRFTSLLKLFNLEERLIFSSKEVSDDLLNKEIDYCEVNKTLEIERRKALSFLMRNLDSSK